MKSKQLKITHYFKKNKKKNINTKNNLIGKIYRKSMKKKIINERKIRYFLYELSRVRI
jgi:hypothetical protein